MKIKPTGINVGILKRQAKKLRKTAGITHIEALNLLAKENGFQSWDHLVRNVPQKVKHKSLSPRPALPQPVTLDYHNTQTGAVIGQHPNRKMAVRRHAQLGSLLQEILGYVEYHKRAKNAMDEIRHTMDTWLACEYDEKTLGNAEFNRIYYGSRHNYEGIPSLKLQMQLQRKLRTMKAILLKAYHDCKPLTLLLRRFEMAHKALQKWPKTVATPQTVKGYLAPGKFVRLKHNRQIAVILSHDTRRKIVEGYSDAGYFTAGRHEVTVLKQQPDIAAFKPLRLYLPYGVWICADGSEVLFNRDYSALWRRDKNGLVSRIQPDAAVDHLSSTIYFDDRSAPYYGHEQTLRTCNAILNKWGVAEQKPIVLELLPVALKTGNYNLINPKGTS